MSGHSGKKLAKNVKTIDESSWQYIDPIGSTFFTKSGLCMKNCK